MQYRNSAASKNATSSWAISQRAKLIQCNIKKCNINPFSTNAPFLFPLKTLEKRRFSSVFRGYRSGTLVENALNSSISNSAILHNATLK